MTTRHPDDLATQAAILAELRQRRIDRGVSLSRAARASGLNNKSYLHYLEHNGRNTVKLATLCRMAWAVAAEPVYTLGLDEPADATAANLHAVFRATGDPVWLSAHLMARIRAVRLGLGLTLADVGDRLGCDQGAVSNLERPGGDVMLATPQKLCRALGGALGVSLVDVEEEGATV